MTKSEKWILLLIGFLRNCLNLQILNW